MREIFWGKKAGLKLKSLIQSTYIRKELHRCSGGILIFIRIRHVSHFIEIVPSETASPSTSPKPPQLGQRRKLENLPEIISVGPEEKARMPPRDHFSPSHSSWCRWKHFAGVKVPIPSTQAYKVFHFHYWIQLAAGFRDLWSQSHC